MRSARGYSSHDVDRVGPPETAADFWRGDPWRCHDPPASPELDGTAVHLSRRNGRDRSRGIIHGSRMTRAPVRGALGVQRDDHRGTWESGPPSRAGRSTTGACRTGGEIFPIRSASLAVTCHEIHYCSAWGRSGSRDRGAGRELPHPVDGHDRRSEPLRRQPASVPGGHLELISEQQP
jgi:hypothetical protein